METKELAKLTEKGKTYLTLSLIGAVILQKWDGITMEEIFKKGIDKVGELLVVHKPMGSIIDLTTSAGVSPRSQEYAATMISNYVKKSFYTAHPGKKYRQVMVIPNDIFISVSAKGFSKKVEGDIETIFTNSIEEAYQLFHRAIL